VLASWWPTGGSVALLYTPSLFQQNSLCTQRPRMMLCHYLSYLLRLEHSEGCRDENKPATMHTNKQIIKWDNKQSGIQGSQTALWEYRWLSKSYVNSWLHKELRSNNKVFSLCDATLLGHITLCTLLLMVHCAACCWWCTTLHCAACCW
jgi:hypothetical protein